MRNETKIEGQRVLKLIMNIVIAGMCFLVVICTFVAVDEIWDISYSKEDADSFYYRLEDGEFYRMVDYYYDNIAEGYEDAAELQEYYGVAKYYEAAAYYKAFLESGDTVRAERELVKMEQALEQMGGWAMVEKDIKQQLGLDVE